MPSDESDNKELSETVRIDNRDTEARHRASLGAIGRYKVIRRIASGGMGDVWLSHHPTLDLPVAIKTLRRSAKWNPDSDEQLQRFLREGRIALRLNHPNLVRVYEVGDDNVYYIVMEYVDGSSVRDLIDQTAGPLPLEQVLTIGLGVAAGLTAAQELDIIHRDIKPGNILLANNGDVKIVDMGLAKDMEANTILTMSDVGVGSPRFMAPEQAQNAKGADTRSDVYSLGALLYRMATGAYAFDGESAYDIIMKHVREPLPMPRKTNPDVPESLERVIVKMMQKDPDDRYQTPADALAALLEVCEDLSLPLDTSNFAAASHKTSLATPRGEAGDAGRSEKPRWIARALVGLPLLAAALVYLAMRQAPVATDNEPPVTEASRSAESGNPATLPLDVSNLPPYLVIDMTGESGSKPYEVVPLSEPPMDIDSIQGRAALKLESRTELRGYVHRMWRSPEWFTGKLLLKRIDPGTFEMGSPGEEEGRNLSGYTESQRSVSITKPFYLGVFEVTRHQWQALTADPQNSGAPVNHSMPITMVSWNEVRGGQWPDGKPDESSFIGRLSAKTELTIDLPTEAQWEYACRAGVGPPFEFYGVNNPVLLGDFANYRDASSKLRSGSEWWEITDETFSDYFPVLGTAGCTFPNEWGLFNMRGNVREWCLDVAVKSSDEASADAAVADRPRSIRGGSYLRNHFAARPAARDGDLPGYSAPDLGFRIVVRP